LCLIFFFLFFLNEGNRFYIVVAIVM